MVIKDLKNIVTGYINRRDTQLLITELLGMTNTEYAVNTDMKVDDDTAANIIEAAKNISDGYPLQYLTGQTEFMSLPFFVNNSVLIPRPDTETLVEKVIEIIENKKLNVLEIGTGSGCISVSIAKYCPGSRVTAVDISAPALDTAKRNARLNDVNINFLLCDIMSEFPADKFDIVVSNPPYIRSGDILNLEKNVRDYEPITALDGGTDGLDFYRRIVSISPDILKSGGLLAFECGYDQADQLVCLMSDAFLQITKSKDLCGIDRVVSGILKK